MSDQTANLSLPFIQGAQAQKHVTHNEALRQLDILTQTGVQTRGLTEPPSDVEDGAAFIIPEDANGIWAGRANQIAAFQDGAFVYFVPKTGWRVYVEDEMTLLVFSGTTWNPVVPSSPESSEGSTGGIGSFETLGVNATADTFNRLLVTTPAVLFNNESGDIRTVLNKNSPGNSASFLFQTGFSGRAEIGLTGSDNFHFRVSADGSNFADGLVLDAATGRARFPRGFESNGILSETLTAVHAQAPVLSGPNSVDFDSATNRLSWQGRFITISAGRGSHYATSGFFEIRQPAVGSLVPGEGGASDDVASAEGIFLDEWDALYYVLPLGNDGSSRDDNFRKVNHTGDFTFPSNELWIFLALRNGDTGEIRLGNGKFI